MIITDAKINEYITEKKILPENFDPVPKETGNALHYEKEIPGEKGNVYKIIIEQLKKCPFDFSVIFGVVQGKTIFRIKRYNGPSHLHTNGIERNKIKGCHIHVATQRYQERKFKEEGYAIPTKKFTDWKTALKLMLEENNFLYHTDKEQERLLKPWPKSK